MIAETTETIHVADFTGRPMRLLRGASFEIRSIGDSSIVILYYGKLYRMNVSDFEKVKDYVYTDYMPRIF